MMQRFDKRELLRKFDAIHEALVAKSSGSAMEFEPISKPARKIFPILYLPVEVKAREFASKAMIAREARKRGLTIIMGASWILNGWLRYLPPGVVLFKSTNAHDAKNITQAVSFGHYTAVLDEEIFGIAPDSDLMRTTIHPVVAMQADLMCMQGPAYAQCFPYPSPLAVTGNPRCLTYSQEHGADILVCLQSGNINNNGRSFEEMVTSSLGVSHAPMATERGRAWARLIRDMIAHECTYLPLVRDTIQALAAAFPDRRIVVRPHPVEDATIWAFNEPNVVLDNSTDIATAMARSAVLVFVSGCTTGLDAYFAGLPAVRLGSGGSGLSAKMHVEANTPAEAVAAVRNPQVWREDLSQYFAPVKLVPHLIKMMVEHPATGTPEITHYPEVFKAKDFHKRKFPDTTAEEVSALVGYPAKELFWNTWQI